MLIFQLNSPVVNIYHINLSLCLSMYVYRVLFSVLLFKFFWELHTFQPHLYYSCPSPVSPIFPMSTLLSSWHCLLFLLLLHKIYMCKKSTECIYNFLDVLLSRADNVALDDLCEISFLMDGSSLISHYLAVALHLGVVPCGTSPSTLACSTVVIR